MSKPSSSLLHYLRMMAGAYEKDARSDSELLSRYAEAHDEAAFAALAVRHGPLVWSICRHVLPNAHDAEDAYQCVFLALARNCSKIRVTKTLSGWLQQVAYRVALNELTKLKSRQRLKTHLETRPGSLLADEKSDDQSHAALHDELAKMPEKLRVALVLHYLESKTQVEVAEILGVTERAVRKRLAQGKGLLQQRLTKKGLALGTASLGSLLAEAAAHSAVPPGLVTKTVEAAAAFRAGKLTGGIAELARQVLRHAPVATNWWMKGWLVAVLCVGGLGVGVGGIAWRAGYFGVDAGGEPAPSKPETSPRSDLQRLKPPRLDLYGDPLPERALARLGTSRLRHAVGGGLREASGFLCNVGSMVFTPDGKGLVTAGIGNPPRLWNVADGKLLRQFGNLPPELIVGVAQSRDGRLLACREGIGRVLGQNKGNLHIWETTTGKLVRTFEGGQSDQVAVNCSFSSDGKMIAARLHDCIGVWEAAAGKNLWMQNGDREDIHDVAFSPDGKVVATADERSSRAVLRDARTGREIRVLTYRGSVHPTLIFSSDSASLLIGVGGNLSLWDLASGKELWKAAGNFPSFSPNGKLIAAYEGALGFIQLLDSSTGKQVRRWLGGDADSPLVFSPDGKMIAYVDGPVIHFCDAASGEELPRRRIRAHESTISSICFLSDNETLISGGDDGSVRVWDSWTGRERQVFGSQYCNRMMIYTDSYQPAFSSTLSPDGKTLAVSFLKSKKDINGLNDLLTTEESACTTLRLWNARTGKELSGFHTSEGTWLLKKMVYSPNGKFLAATLKRARPLSEELMVWDLSTGKQCGLRLPGFQPAFSPDGDVLFAFQNEGGGGGKRSWIKFCDIASGKTVHEIKLQKVITSMAASPDSGMIAATNSGVGGNGITLASLHWGPGSSRVSHGSLREIEFSSATCLQTCAFSADGRLLAVGGDDKIVHVWEVASGKERARFTGHIGSVRVLCFSQDGKRLVSGGVDGGLLVWDLTNRLQENGRLHPLRCSEAQLEELWKKLRDANAIQAGLVVWKLTAADQAAVTLLKKRLRPVQPAASAKAVDRFVADLDANAFQVRKRAHDALVGLGDQCEPVLRQALTKKPSVERRRAIETLLAMWESQRNSPSTDVCRQLRGVEILEKISTPAAKALLSELAGGAAGARLTMEAKVALNRLEQAQRRQKDALISAKELQR